MPRYKLIIEYDGTNYCGWQVQPQRESVCSVINSAIKRATGEDVSIYGSGRTDAGVHARAQVAHVDIAKKWDAFSFQGAINHYLKDTQIVIVKLEQIDSSFHARFSAYERIYRYFIINRYMDSPLLKQRAWVIYPPLDIKAMMAGAKYLIGEHDFTTFRSIRCQANTAVRIVKDLQIWQDERTPSALDDFIVGDLIICQVQANSFLHHQVRNFIGTLALVGLGRWQPEDIKIALAQKDRTQGGPTAPAQGLYLWDVIY